MDKQLKKEERKVQKIVKKYTRALKRRKAPNINDYINKCSSEEGKGKVKRLCMKAIVNNIGVDPLGDLGCH